MTIKGHGLHGTHRPLSTGEPKLVAPTKHAKKEAAAGPVDGMTTRLGFSQPSGDKDLLPFGGKDRKLSEADAPAALLDLQASVAKLGSTSSTAGFVDALATAVALAQVKADGYQLAKAVGVLSEAVVVAAIAAFFSSFSSPVLSGVFTFGIFAVGRATPELRAAIESADASPIIRGVCQVALWAAPDLNLFQISGTTLGGRPISVHGEFVSWSYVLSAAGHGALYAGFFLALAVAIFSRRDFL